MSNDAIANGVIDTSPGRLDSEEIMMIIGYTGKALDQLFIEKNPMLAFAAVMQVVKILGYGDKIKEFPILEMLTATTPKK